MPKGQYKHDPERGNQNRFNRRVERKDGQINYNCPQCNHRNTFKDTGRDDYFCSECQAKTNIP